MSTFKPLGESLLSGLLHTAYMSNNKMMPLKDSSMIENHKKQPNPRTQGYSISRAIQIFTHFCTGISTVLLENLEKNTFKIQMRQTQ